MVATFEITAAGGQIETCIYLAAEQGSFPGAHAEEEE